MKRQLLVIALMIISSVAFGKKPLRECSFISEATAFFNAGYWSEKDSVRQFLDKHQDYQQIDKPIERTIDFNHWQWISYTTCNDSFFCVFVQGMGNNVYAIVISHIVYHEYEMDEKEITRKTNDYFLSQYLDLHNCMYGTAWNVRNFETGSFERFGIGCGGAGMPSALFVKGMSMAKNKDQAGLLKLATSISPEERMMGALGLSLLQKLGVSLNAYEERIIRLVQNSIIPIAQCEGCTSRETRPIKDLLTEETIEIIFRAYNSYLTTPGERFR